MTIYDAGPLAAGPLCGLLTFAGVLRFRVLFGACPEFGNPEKFARIKRFARICESIRANQSGAHQGGHATARFLEGFLEGSLTIRAS